MKTGDYWKTFESTGEVKDYLSYKQHCAEEEQNHAADDDGAGAAGDKDG